MGRRLHPKEVVARADLTRDEKIALLREWDQDLRALLVAEEENMLAAAPPEVTLQEVSKALALLGFHHESPGAPTKHG